MKARLFSLEWKKLRRRQGLLLLFFFFLFAAPLTTIVLRAAAIPDSAPPSTQLSEEDRQDLEEMYQSSYRKQISLERQLLEENADDSLYDQIYWARQEVLFFEAALVYELPIWDFSYLSETASVYAWNRVNLSLYEEASDSESLAEKERLLAENEQYLEIMQKKDYGLYLDFQKEKVEADSDLSSQEKEWELERLAYLAQYDPQGAGIHFALQNTLNEKERIEKSLASGADFYHDTTGSTPLNEKTEALLLKRSLILKTQLANGLVDFSYFGNRSVRLPAQSAEFFLLLFLVVFLYSLFAEELQSGSIGFLFSAPVPKKAVFSAKVRVLLCALAGCFLLLYAELLLGTVLAFPKSTVSFVVFWGEIRILPFALYCALSLLSRFLVVFFLAALALLFSIWIPKKPLGLIVPPVLYLASPVILTGLELGSFSEKWTLLLPFPHFSLSHALFPTALEEMTGSALFSLGYLLLSALLFSLTARVLFCRKQYYK